jgi:hypothetical protein
MEKQAEANEASYNQILSRVQRRMAGDVTRSVSDKIMVEVVGAYEGRLDEIRRVLEDERCVSSLLSFFPSFHSSFLPSFFLFFVRLEKGFNVSLCFFFCFLGGPEH